MQLNERVARLEVSVELIAGKLERFERRLWALGLLVVAGANAADVMKMVFFWLLPAADLEAAAVR